MTIRHVDYTNTTVLDRNGIFPIEVNHFSTRDDYVIGEAVQGSGLLLFGFQFYFNKIYRIHFLMFLGFDIICNLKLGHVLEHHKE